MSQGKIGDLTLAAGTALKDAEFRRVGAKDTPVCEFALMVGKKPDGKGIFANCKAWRSLAEYAAAIRKGDPVFVAGHIESREYNGKTYTTLTADWLNVVCAAPELAGTPDVSMSTFTELGAEDGDTLPF